jgi:MoxR-like ATPase
MNAFRDSAGHERELLSSAIEQLNTVVLGKDREIRLSVACLLARGHLLIEDIPGVGKTTLAHALSRVLGLTYQRVQFTSDLLPADVIAVPAASSFTVVRSSPNWCWRTRSTAPPRRRRAPCSRRWRSAR